MNVKGRGKFEVLIVLIVIVLAVAVGAGLYASRSKINNGKRVQAELATLRSAVSLYMTINKAAPPNLEILLKSTYDAGGGMQRHFVDNMPTNAEGKPVDPFGKPYVFEPQKSLVYSSSRGYEKW